MSALLSRHQNKNALSQSSKKRKNYKKKQRKKIELFHHLPLMVFSEPNRKSLKEFPLIKYQHQIMISKCEKGTLDENQQKERRFLSGKT
jgi:hypothetical protein